MSSRGSSNVNLLRALEKHYVADLLDVRHRLAEMTNGPVSMTDAHVLRKDLENLLNRIDARLEELEVALAWLAPSTRRK